MKGFLTTPLAAQLQYTFTLVPLKAPPLGRMTTGLNPSSSRFTSSILLLGRPEVPLGSLLRKEKEKDKGMFGFVLIVDKSIRAFVRHWLCSGTDVFYFWKVWIWCQIVWKASLLWLRLNSKIMVRCLPNSIVAPLHPFFHSANPRCEYHLTPPPISFVSFQVDPFTL